MIAVYSGRVVRSLEEMVACLLRSRPSELVESKRIEGKKVEVGGLSVMGFLGKFNS